ncbi:uncharacterized protein FIBRA_04841 [Fibroporia radiculosa]|uniref:Uncharacterized protein n=1 Tax=Fibroporia radiculosa TaxID=599839 RepID=J4H365_9APHY|nr:uncharacterized protein FIBRA_04841 [Fibroporia radiculosa]CCM02734.1 predicted protein [Fibroporia radiculosa]
MRASTVLVGLGTLVFAPALVLAIERADYSHPAPPVPAKPAGYYKSLTSKPLPALPPALPPKPLYREPPPSPYEYNMRDPRLNMPRLPNPHYSTKPPPPLPNQRHNRRRAAEDGDGEQSGRDEAEWVYHNGIEQFRDGGGRENWHRTRSLVVRALLDELD